MKYVSGYYSYIEVQLWDDTVIFKIDFLWMSNNFERKILWKRL